MNLHQLEYFIRVAELGSFSKAAVVLDVAQPALSRQVRLLEADLRTTLLLRNGRGVTLTEMGRLLYERAADILQAVSNMGEEIAAQRDEPVGQVVIGLPPSLGRMLAVPLVEAFQRELPKARLSIVEGLTTHLVEWLASARVDLALLHSPEANPAIDIAPVMRERLGLVAPIDYRSPAGAEIPLSQLVELPLVLPERAHVLRRLLETRLAQAGLKPEVRLEVSSVPSILSLVSAGYGYAVLTRSALAANGQQHAFSFHPLSEHDLCSTLCLAVPSRKHPTPLLRRSREVLAGLMSELREKLGGEAELSR
ncbi:LysR family transcriptional regulator [Uliginosibacterium sediminicola]|uniref:LysR substrate-binding domain-containing protein n=1 Tax=Uliginosibacterium sediminicola TaxID=2024550 RepID=A0ABU9Z045_9RHOO